MIKRACFFWPKTHIMNIKFLILSTFLFIAVHGISQFSVGGKVGASLAVQPNTDRLFVNREDSFNESLFNAEHVSYSPQLGVMGRFDIPGFWFMSELMYGQVTTEYSIEYTRRASEGASGPIFLDERRSYFELPVSAGVTLGNFEIFSGFSAAHDFSIRSDLNQVNGYSEELPALRFGWHTGAGINIGQILLDVRYQQEFRNYGQDRFIDGQELLLRNTPARMVVTAGFRI